MRLTSARIRGFGRLVDTKINLDAKLIAVVGPNEAGKSTLLDALAHLNGPKEVPSARRSRGAVGIADNSRAIEATFQLDEEDRGALKDLDLEEMPVRALIARTMSGEGPYVDLEPVPRKRRAPIEDVATSIRELVASVQGPFAFTSEDGSWSTAVGDQERDFGNDLSVLAEGVDAFLREPSAVLEANDIQLAEEMAAALSAEQEASASLKGVLNRLIAWAKVPDPAGAARDTIWHRTPAFLLFGESDRALRSTYTFDESLAQNAPGALANLAATAGLDLEQLHEYHASNDVTRRQTALNRGNKRLEEFFRGAWRQSDLSVQLSLDGDLLRIQLEEDNGSVTVFDERSAGLRMFVALVCFLATRESDVPPVLLVDEAENHLHLDAQADLVNMFVSQDQAAKIIYTTHSPGCLPPDLGTGIRSVVPSEEVDRSDVRNSFWEGAAGYSPLMMAMGASAAAFTPTRRVVLAEGAADMLLYPSLIRRATGLSELPYQVAPGLAEVSRDLLTSLDLEAAKVAYLVDKDQGGKKLRKTLVDSGVPEDLVISAEAPGVEALVAPDCLRDAFAALLPECNLGLTVEVDAIPAAATGSKTLDQSLREWAKTRGLQAPGKVAVGNWLVQNAAATSTESQREVLRGVHERLLKALG
ncbi:AAA family ATPase [Curtobacterium sp. MCPF17_011]|uniref:AAA family ATPase n=1 Tax=Curtobacterium sp. MCPF17_011 TaxID=2175652 RepID=UPI0015E87C5E|nr:AAA family ATPase [Curtobacterium sp. MCPF17_011]